jgi:hypothetical protein
MSVPCVTCMRINQSALTSFVFSAADFAPPVAFSVVEPACFFFSDDQISICRTSNVLVMKRLQTKCLLRLLRHLFTSLDRGREPPADRLVDL